MLKLNNLFINPVNLFICSNFIIAKIIETYFASQVTFTIFTIIGLSGTIFCPSTACVYNIAEALQYDMRQLRRTRIETVDSLPLPLEPNTLIATAHQ